MTPPTAENLYAEITANPGSTIRDIADAFGIRYQSIYNALPTLEKPGMLIYEDELKRLYPLGYAKETTA